MASINLTHFEGLAAGASVSLPVDVTTSTTSGVIASSINPEGVPVIATICYAYIQQGSAAACTLDIGVAATNVLSDTIMDGISVNAAANTVYDNITDKGANGLTRQYVPAGGYFTASVASGNANGLIGLIQFNYELLSGGDGYTPGVL